MSKWQISEEISTNLTHEVGPRVLGMLLLTVDCHWCQHQIVDCPWCQQQMLEALYLMMMMCDPCSGHSTMQLGWWYPLLSPDDCSHDGHGYDPVGAPDDRWLWWSLGDGWWWSSDGDCIWRWSVVALMMMMSDDGSYGWWWLWSPWWWLVEPMMM